MDTLIPTEKIDEPKSLELLYLLQLSSPVLPVGAYSYSEGLETLVATKIINDRLSLKHWIEQELNYGAIRLEVAVMYRAYQNTNNGDLAALKYWNAWLSAARETEELRLQSWQMGRSLLRLIGELHPEAKTIVDSIGNPCNYAIAFGIAAAQGQINSLAAVLGYLHSWATNLINAGVKLIPLGQTAGQQLLLDLYKNIENVAHKIIALKDDELSSCGWGLALASMTHETEYSRLFRS